MSAHAAPQGACASCTDRMPRGGLTVETTPQPAVCGLVTTVLPPGTRNRHVLTSAAGAHVGQLRQRKERFTPTPGSAVAGPRACTPSPGVHPGGAGQGESRSAVPHSFLPCLFWPKAGAALPLRAFPLNSVAWATANRRWERYHYPPLCD